MIGMAELHIIQHKMFMPYGTHPSICFAKTFFMLEMLYEVRFGRKEVEKCVDYLD